MGNLQREPSNGNRIKFIGNIGRFVRRQTGGISVDVAHNDRDSTTWYRVLPVNSDILRRLSPGDRVEISGVILRSEPHLLVNGVLRLIETRGAPDGQLPLW